MDPADAAGGRRRTQAWLGLPDAPAPAGPQRSLRWMPNNEGLPSYPASPSGSAAMAFVAAPVIHGARSPGMIVGDRYRLVNCLGRGNATETWEAIHTELGHSVAIKFPHSARASAAAVGEAMLAEARAVAGLRHPHIVEFTDFGRTPLGEPFFVMEHLRGQTVAALLEQRGTIAWARVVAIVQQVAQALEAAHQQRVLHSNIRPENLFLIDAGQVGDYVKVLDWGLAGAGAVGGAPNYMSPEQCRGEQLDPRSDIYAVGCLLFALVTGDPPFRGDPQAVIAQQLYEPAKTLRERAPRQFIPEELESIVARCLAKQPEQRFASAAELSAHLAHLAQFSAAASKAGAPIADHSPSNSRPMGYAGRPAPKSPRELTDSYKPIPVQAPAQAPSGSGPASPGASSGMSPPAIVAATLAGVFAVIGFGVGMYVLVQRLIDEPSAPAAKIEGGQLPSTGSKPEAPPSPGPQAKPAQATPVQTASLPLPPSGSGAGVDSAATADPTTTPAAAKSKSASKPTVKPTPVSPSVEPEPAAPETTPETPASKPAAKPKPSTDPDSKATDKIGHSELLDPWG